MSVVLLESRRIGRTSWVAVRGQEGLRILGMGEGDTLKVTFRGSGEQWLVVGDTSLQIPEGADAVRIEHIETSGSKVSVDLVRGE